MTIMKRGVQVFLLAVGVLILSGCYAVVEDRHYYRSKPHFDSYRHHDYRPHHRHYYNYQDDDRDRRHRRGGQRHHR